MERQPIQSGMFRAMGYDADAKTLEVEFANGGVYAYDGVTPEEYEALSTAESKGGHFSRHIRGKYASRKVEATRSVE